MFLQLNEKLFIWPSLESTCIEATCNKTTGKETNKAFST